MRILICLYCKTLESVEDHTQSGPDVLLETLVAGHATAHPHAMNSGGLVHVLDKDWARPEYREQVLHDLREGLVDRPGEVSPGMGVEFYDLKDTFREDAMTCWTRDHNRNPACSDYKSDAKKLSPGTEKERKSLGISTQPYGTTRYLCEFCPVHTLVVEAARKRAGMYK